MKNTVPAYVNTLPQMRVEVSDVAQLIRPRLALLVLVTVAAGFCLASEGRPNPVRLFQTIFDTALVVAGASALNQVLERHHDATMKRTKDRPVASGRLHPEAVCIFGASLVFAGCICLAVTMRHPLAVLLLALAFAIYVFLYTPLKRITTLNTLVGAIPGALPPLIGWTAATNALDARAVVLFAILYLWQVPHFLAIAWIYRNDYARGGMRMLPERDSSGRGTARQMVSYSLALIAASMIPSCFGWTGPLYLVGACGLGIGLMACACRFMYAVSDARARWMLRASLVYLPTLLILPIIDGLLKT